MRLEHKTFSTQFRRKPLGQNLFDCLFDFLILINNVLTEINRGNTTIFNAIF